MSREHAPYFFVSPSSFQETIWLRGEDARHLAVVRRAKPGDRVWVGDGRGNVAEVSLETIEKDQVMGRVMTKSQNPRPKPVITVVQAMTKGSKVDGIVQKLVEIGVDRICLVSSDRSIVRWDEQRRTKVSERLSAIGLEAAKQSHRAWLPEIVGPADFELAMSEIAAASVSLVAHPAAKTPLGQMSIRHTDSIALAVGPEGGWSSDELDAMQGAGAAAITVGDQILRSETAPLVIAALVMHLAGRLG